MACQLKEKKIKHILTRAHTPRTGTQKNKEPSIFQRYTQSTTNTNSELCYNILPFLIQKMPILGVYIYIFIFSVVYVTYFLNILVLLHATVSCI